MSSASAQMVPCTINLGPELPGKQIGMTSGACSRARRRLLVGARIGWMSLALVLMAMFIINIGVAAAGLRLGRTAVEIRW
jgi:hypothetical protein